MRSSARYVRNGGLPVVLMAAAVSMANLAVAQGPVDRGVDSLTRLKTGNARFVADASEALPITAPGRAALTQGQSPYASILSCADSRVPPEVIFHTGLGDLFVVRAAGHVADRSVLASLEYGAEHLHTPLLVVMGHESCGAVKAAMDTPATKSMGPNLDYLLQSIRPAVARTAGQPADTRLRAAILANVEESINQLLDTSEVLKQMTEAQHLTIVGAYYELASGRAHFSEPVRVMSRAPARTVTSGALPHAPAAGVRTGGVTPAAPVPAGVSPAVTAKSASTAAPTSQKPQSVPAHAHQAPAAAPAPKGSPASAAAKDASMAPAQKGSPAAPAAKAAPAAASKPAGH